MSIQSRTPADLDDTKNWLQAKHEDIDAIREFVKTQCPWGFVGIMASAKLERESFLRAEIERENAKPEPDLKRIAKNQKQLDSGSFRYAESAFRFASAYHSYTRNQMPSDLDAALAIAFPEPTELEVQRNRYRNEFVQPLVTGGGPGIMRACREGWSAAEASDLPPLSIAGTFRKTQHKEFVGARCLDVAVREAGLIDFANVLLVWPGGYGTLWELFESLSKTQLEHRPVSRPTVLVHGDFWFQALRGIPHLLQLGTIELSDRIHYRDLQLVPEELRPLFTEEKSPFQLVDDDAAALLVTIESLKAQITAGRLATLVKT